MEGLIQNPRVWAFTSAKVSLWILVLARVTGLLATFPGLGQERLNLRARGALAALLSLLLLPAVPPLKQWPTGIWDLMAVLAMEFAVGSLMGTMAAWVLEAVAFGSQAMDTQMGFTFMQIVDPVNAQAASVSGALLGQVGLLLMFALGLHHQLILGLAESYRTLPMGSGFPLHVPELVAILGQLLARGLQLAMPVLIVLVVVDLIQGLSGKLMPQLQLMQLVFPLKIGLGLVLLGYVLREFPAWIAPLFERVPRLALDVLR